jgi:hypothetical protein
MQTPEGIQRVNKAQSALTSANAEVANAAERFMSHIAWCSADEVCFNHEGARDDAENINALIERRNEAQHEFLCAISGRPNTQREGGR